MRLGTLACAPAIPASAVALRLVQLAKKSIGATPPDNDHKEMDMNFFIGAGAGLGGFAAGFGLAGLVLNMLHCRRSKRCPHCAERLTAHALFCRYCGDDFHQSEGTRPTLN